MLAVWTEVAELQDRDAVKLQKRLARLYDKADGLISKRIGIGCAIKLLTRMDKRLIKEWGKTQSEIQAIRKELGEVETL